ncbi:hypothetical protein EIP91_007148 [Steccherinum ochraceum]|uniref:Ca(2+)-dependent cysteine protease n=1 Tax=Steccherinum ochraceum TaxID=92696 RepID=A0A4R0RT36_9APHY|nr:hypothetical protein EIP91_007148 [Steccherinum ochraceum]
MSLTPESDVLPSSVDHALDTLVPASPVLQHHPNRKRALLIGITYRDAEHERERLIRPVEDVAAFKGLLIRKYAYEDEGIVVMTDTEDVMDHLQPTKANILREIRHLVTGTEAGDALVFLYAGHSHQRAESKKGNEQDGKDECIETMDGEEIIDNDLKATLVEPLPVGSRLTAIFDSCHSGTLLDLPHYLCNTRGLTVACQPSPPSSTASSRQSTAFSGSGSFSLGTGTDAKSNQSSRNNSTAASPNEYDSTGHTLSLVIPAETASGTNIVHAKPFTVSPESTLSLGEAAAEEISENLTTPIAAVGALPVDVGRVLGGESVQSPIQVAGSLSEECEGDCELSTGSMGPVVLSISSCMDNERTYEDAGDDSDELKHKEPDSLIKVLVDILDQNPYPPLEKFIIAVRKRTRTMAIRRAAYLSKSLKEFDVHAISKGSEDYEDYVAAKAAEEEMKRQNALFGSLHKLDRSQTFDLGPIRSSRHTNRFHPYPSNSSDTQSR